MDFLFIKGVITGIILSLPFGALGIYCMEKTLVEGQLKGYASAIGMVTVDFIYGIVALLFVGILREYLEKFGFLFSGLIGLILIILGLKKIFRNPEVEDLHPKKDNYFQNYITVFAFAIFNVQSILVIIGIYTLLDKWMKVSRLIKITDLDDMNKVTIALYYGLGIFVGGAVLWYITTTILYFLRKKITTAVLFKIIRIAGIGIVAFGTITVLSSLLHFIKWN